MLIDVLSSYVSVEAARRLYGVVIEGNRVDEDGTRRLRQEKRRCLCAYAHVSDLNFTQPARSRPDLPGRSAAMRQAARRS